MKKLEELRKIKHLISEDKKDDAIARLNAFIQKEELDEFEDSIISIKARYKQLERDRANGILDYDKLDRLFNNIRVNFLEIISTIARIIIENTKKPSKEESNNNESNDDDIAEDPISRTELIAEYARKYFNDNNFEVLREKSNYSSFSIPNRAISDLIWDLRDRLDKKRRSDRYRKLQRNQRVWLEKYVNNSYCKLIIKPSFYSTKKGLRQTMIRLRTLLSFIESNKDKIDIVSVDNLNKENILIVGNKFFTKSITPTKEGYWDTEFEFEKEKVEWMIKEFDNEFNEILNRKKIDVFESRKQVIQEIKDQISTLEKEELEDE